MLSKHTKPFQFECNCRIHVYVSTWCGWSQWKRNCCAQGLQKVNLMGLSVFVCYYHIWTVTVDIGRYDMDNYSDKRFEQYDTHRSFNIWDTQHSTQSKPIVAIISNLCFSVYGFWLFLWDNWNTTTMPYAIGARFQGFLHFGQLAPLSVFFRFSFEFWIDQEQKWKKKKFLVSTSCYCNSIMHCHCSFYGGMNSKTFEVFKLL